MTQHGDRIMPWIALAGTLAFLAVVAVFVIGALVERRAERLREAEAAAFYTAPLSTVAERPMEAIALDGATDEEREYAAKIARLEAWLADVGSYRRADLATLDESLAAVYELAYEGLEPVYDRAHDFAELAEMGERPLATLVDATDTREWSDAEVAELNAMLAAGEADLYAGAGARP